VEVLPGEAHWLVARAFGTVLDVDGVSELIHWALPVTVKVTTPVASGVGGSKRANS
jgi:hypothetical protein